MIYFIVETGSFGFSEWSYRPRCYPRAFRSRETVFGVRDVARFTRIQMEVESIRVFVNGKVEGKLFLSIDE